jgi:hypothetical protein
MFGGGGGTPGLDAPPPSGEGALPPEGSPPEGGESEITPESRMKNMKLLVERDLTGGSKFLNLGQAQKSLGEIEKELDKLLNS